jgi:hypothetical protein
LDFGNQPDGSSTAKTFDITATLPAGACARGVKPVVITGESITGESGPSDQPVFTVSGDCAEKSIAPSQSCTETVTFKSDTEGAFNATMQVSANNASNSPQSVSLTASAYAVLQ